MFWLQPDTADPGSGLTDLSIGVDPLTMNRYSYVNGDPINYWDPTGHASADTAERRIEAAQARGEGIRCGSVDLGGGHTTIDCVTAPTEGEADDRWIAERAVDVILRDGGECYAAPGVGVTGDIPEDFPCDPEARFAEMQERLRHGSGGPSHNFLCRAAHNRSIAEDIREAPARGLRENIRREITGVLLQDAANRTGSSFFANMVRGGLNAQVVAQAVIELVNAACRTSSDDGQVPGSHGYETNVSEEGVPNWPPHYEG